MSAYWLSTTRMTVLAETDGEGTIVRTAPITRRFLGQDLDRLVAWLRGLGGFHMAEIGPAAARQLGPVGEA